MGSTNPDQMGLVLGSDMRARNLGKKGSHGSTWAMVWKGAGGSGELLKQAPP